MTEGAGHRNPVPITQKMMVIEMTASTLEELESLTAGDVTAEATTDATEAETDTGTDGERSERLRAARKDKSDRLFGEGRKYEIRKHVKVPAGSPKFITPFGNKGSDGFLMTQVEGTKAPGFADFEDMDPVRFPLGTTAVQEAQTTYGCFTNFDTYLKTKRPRKSKAEKDAAKAAEKAAARALLDQLFESDEFDVSKPVAATEAAPVATA